MMIKNDVYIGRYCHACGKKHEKDASACPSCGARFDRMRFMGIERVGAAGVGFSHKTDDPSFSSNKKRYKKVTLIIVPIICIVIALILLAFGVPPLVALIIGLLLIAIILPLSLLQFRTKKTWEGTVKKKKHIINNTNGRRSVYKIYFETEDGKRKTQKWNASMAIYGYLQEGDRVRYDGEIGGAFAYEKYDKSKDENIVCVSCGILQDARQTYCTSCGSPLMKGNPLW